MDMTVKHPEFWLSVLSFLLGIFAITEINGILENPDADFVEVTVMEALTSDFIGQENIFITYKGEEIRDASYLIVSIANKSGRIIKASEWETVITLTLSRTESVIIEANVQSFNTVDEQPFPVVRTDHQILIPQFSMKPQEEIGIYILVSNYTKGSMSASGRIAGQNIVLSEPESTKESVSYFFIFTFLLYLFISLSSLNKMGLINIPICRWKATRVSHSRR